ncbi:MAG: hypothetical protein PSV18_13865 [Methylobacter sp.]|nr:hypothetical protein [Candidatus Methylobacter titanis]
MNEEVTKKNNDASASLSNSNNPLEGGGFRPAKKFDETQGITARQLVQKHTTLGDTEDTKEISMFYPQVA